MITLLDGPIGSLLTFRGVPTPPPLWSANALQTAPDMVAQIHGEYAGAGACVHTANTFRTGPRAAGPEWEDLTRRAVAIARSSIPSTHRVAGSIAPARDCYRPDLSPEDPRPEHRLLAQCLAQAGVDLILCETFAHVGEGLIAVEEAVATGLPVWAAFTGGPDGSLLSPFDLAIAARQAAERGAQAVLVNCIASELTLSYVEAISRVVPPSVPFGAYANAGGPGDWNATDNAAVERYVLAAMSWVDAGATIVGSCCGTSPVHIVAIDHALQCRR